MKTLVLALALLLPGTALANQFDQLKAECQRDNPRGDDWKLCLQLRGWAMIGPPPAPSAPDVIVLPQAERPVQPWPWWLFAPQQRSLTTQCNTIGSFTSCNTF